MNPLVALAITVAFIVWSAYRREIFRIEVRRGSLRVARGSVPPGLLHDFRAVLRAPPVERCTIFAFRGWSGATLYVSGGLDDGRAQRLRNIFALFPASQLRAAPEPGDRSVSDMLATMLRWLFGRR
jgi:hypothetical protein